jgi:orotate phosphoribosyltransferase
MVLNKDTAEKVAQFLLQIKAVKLSPSAPFTWASGWKSPIYCDNRISLSYPQTRTFLRQQFSSQIIEQFGKPDVIAGVATGAIAIGALVAEELGLPFVYVRSSAKEHGMGNLIEGFVEKGQSVVVVEDLISTGGSSLKAVEALRTHGCKVKGMAAIFTYGFEQSEKAFQDSKCKLITLTDYSTLIKKAFDQNFVTAKEVESLKEWRKKPDTWGV